MQQNAGGNIYVPPALRGATGGDQPGNFDSNAPVVDRGGGYSPRYQGSGGGGGGGYGGGRGGYQQRDYGNDGGGYNKFGGGGGGGYYQQQGGYQGGSGYGGGSGGGYQQQGGYQGGGSYGGGGFSGNTGYGRGGSGGYNNSYGGGRGGGRYGDRGGGDFGGYSGGGGARKNSIGFHGDETPNPRLEQELFHSGDAQVTGINFDKYDDIPIETSQGCPEPFTEFTEETIGVQLLKNVYLSKFTRPTPVQKYSIPIGLSGGDMMACAQTGSGKTAGFLFPVITIMTKSGGLPEPEGRRPGQKACYISALILAPTRELASQIYDEAQKFCYCTGIRPVVIYGGANIQNQQKELDRGADLLVATPGRLVDLIERGRIRLDNVKFLILDEADRMLDMGFEPQIRRIVEEEGMPKDRQTFMFSATFPVSIQKLAGDFMKHYIFVAVGRVGAASKDVTQRIEWVEQNDKLEKVIEFLGRVPEGLVLIFVETKRGADYVEYSLGRENFPASSIHGDKSQREREDALKMFKSGRTPILVATDVAARGLDIPNVTQVINFDMPSNIDDYVHRIGRTGRVGNVGNALSYFNEKNRNIGKELAELLIENEQECPVWLEEMSGFNQHHGGRGGGGRGRGRGGKTFGSRDYRKEQGGGGGGGSSTGGRGHSSHGSSGSSGGRAPSGPPMQSYSAPRETGYSDSRDNSAW